jgi:hypothetical protein
MVRATTHTWNRMTRAGISSLLLTQISTGSSASFIADARWRQLLLPARLTTCLTCNHPSSCTEHQRRSTSAMKRASSVSPVAGCVVQHQTPWLDERDRELIDTHVEEWLSRGVR